MVGGRLAGARIGVLGRGVQARQRRRPRLPGALDRRPARTCRAPRSASTTRGPTTPPRHAFPTLTYADSAVEACRDADLVLHLTEWPEFRELTPADLEGVVERPQLFDGRNVLDLDAWRSAGWTARALGRR